MEFQRAIEAFVWFVFGAIFSVATYYIGTFLISLIEYDLLQIISWVSLILIDGLITIGKPVQLIMSESPNQG